MTPFYSRDGVTIYCGETLATMAELPAPVDAIIADLPYGTTACSWDTVIPFEPLWANYKRLIKPRGAVVLFGSQPFTSALVMSNPGWFKYEWVWDKKMIANFGSVKYQPLRQHEIVLIFSDGAATYNPQYRDSVLIPFGRSSGGERSTPTGTYGQNFKNGVGYPKTILEFPRPNNLTDGGLHPTQKPVDLMAYLIRTYTNPGELILDNTMGSGTTLVAAQREGRRAIGIELSEEYCRIAVDRLRQPSFFSIPAQREEQPQPVQAGF